MNTSKNKSKKKDKLATWKAYKFIHDTQDYEPNYSITEIDQLCTHYINEDYNQFFLIIIKRVLDHREFDCDDNTIILGLLVEYDKFDFEDLAIYTEEDIMYFATMQYKVLMIKDIDEDYLTTEGF